MKARLTGGGFPAFRHEQKINKLCSLKLRPCPDQCGFNVMGLMRQAARASAWHKM
jgi:hypothetical protein